MFFSQLALSLHLETYNDENMRRFRYPVDTDQFADIRKDGKVYVDKTDMVYDLVDRYKYVFLARPRRFVVAVQYVQGLFPRAEGTLRGAEDNGA